MKRILIGITVLLVAANVAKAQTIENDLVGLGMQPEQASYLASVIPLGSTFSNAAWHKWRNAGDTADVNVLRLDATDDTELASDSGDVIKIRPAGDANRLFTLDAASDTAHTITFGDGGTTAAQTLAITGSTSNADDDSSVSIAGAGAISNSRGAYLIVKGENFASGGGDATLSASGNIYISGASADSTVVLYTNALARWTVGTAGELTSNGTNGGNLVFAKAGTGVVDYVGTLAAAGSVLADAAQLVTPLTTVTAADATKGVKLPATPTAGETYTVINTANAVLKLWPGSGDAISGLGAGNNMALAAYTLVTCVAVSASQWWCGEPAVAA